MKKNSIFLYQNSHAMKTQLEETIEQKLPLILQNLHFRKGAVSATTTGAWNDIDSSDKT